MRKIFIVILCVALFISIIVGCFSIVKDMQEKREIEAQMASRNAEIEGLIEKFKAAHSSISFDITYRYALVDGEVVYYIEGGSNLEEYFSAQKKKYCRGFGYLTEFGSVDEITVYINGDKWTTIDDLSLEKEMFLRRCRYENCMVYCEKDGDFYCVAHRCSDRYCKRSREDCWEHN